MTPQEHQAHLGRDKMTAIFQTTFSNAHYCLNTVFQVQIIGMYSLGCNGRDVIISSDNGTTPNR